MSGALPFLSSAEPVTVEYAFTLENGREERFCIRLDGESCALLDPLPADLPAWTKLAFEQCPHCPLSAAETPHCPLAARIADVVDRFSDVVSHAPVRTEVRLPDRTVVKQADAQQGVSSLLGLLMATSGCPRTAWLKPLARFHTPFAGGEETLFRAAGMYLLAQHFRARRGRKPDLALDLLTGLYRDLQVLNTAVAKRVRAARGRDAAVNAVVVLDFFAANFSLSMEHGLEELEPLFAPHMQP